MISRARAYYDVASEGFTDIICQTIFAKLVPDCEKGLVPHLMTRLGLDDVPSNRNYIVELMTEDPDRERRRRQLQDKAARLSDGYDFISVALSSSHRQTGLAHRPQSLQRDLQENRAVTGTTSVTPNKRGYLSGHENDENVMEESPTKRRR